MRTFTVRIDSTARLQQLTGRWIDTELAMRAERPDRSSGSGGICRLAWRGKEGDCREGEAGGRREAGGAV